MPQRAAICCEAKALALPTCDTAAWKAMHKITLHAEPTEFSADVLPRGTHPAVWTNSYLKLLKCDTRVPTSIRLPGSVAVDVLVTDELMTITMEMEPIS